jgi:general stress protein 26
MITYHRVNKQYVAMGEVQVWDFLETRRVLMTAFVREDGYPHLTPVWFVIADRKIYFRATSNKVKVKLAEGAKVCCAAEDGSGFDQLRGVVVWGRSRIVTELRLIERYNTLKSVKYAGASSTELDMPEAWARRRAIDPLTIIEIAPERISSWDNTKLDQWRDETPVSR